MKKLVLLAVGVFLPIIVLFMLRANEKASILKNKDEAHKDEAQATASWLDDFEKAKSTAKAENKHILMDFTGSDWCGWCISLTKEVFSQPEFAAFANEKLVLMKVDFPRGKKQSSELIEQNEALAEKYEILGFPTIIVLDSNGELVEKTGYQSGGAAAYVDHLTQIIAGK